MIEYRGDGLGGIRKTPKVEDIKPEPRNFGDAFGTKESKSVRQEITYRNFVVQRKDPWFLWYIYTPDGLPLSGSFTSLEVASRFVDQHLLEQDKKRNSLQEQTEEETLFEKETNN